MVHEVSLSYFKPSFSDLVNYIDEQLTFMDFNVSDKDMAQPELCAVWIVPGSPKASVSISAMKKTDGEVVLLLQSCFLSLSKGGVMKGPKRIYVGDNGAAAGWLNDNLPGFHDMVKLFSGITEMMPGMIEASHLGALIDESQRASPGADRAERGVMEHTFRVRFSVRQHIVDLYFTTQLVSDGVNVLYRVNDSAPHVISGLNHENLMVQHILGTIDAIKARFFIDPDIYERIVIWPGSYGENVVALPQNTAKTNTAGK